MSVTEESKLNADLKNGRFKSLYFLFGEEPFLTVTYEKKIISLTVGEDTSGMNIIRFNGNPLSDTVSDFAESLPFFSDYKCVVISDFEPDKLDNPELSSYLKLFENLPDSTILIISETGVEIDAKKPKAKLKKILAAAEKYGCLCELKLLSANQAAALAMKKAEKLGCSISRNNAVYLSELCGRSLSNISNEIQKLCDYTISGEISKDAIENMTPRLIETRAYELSSELFAGRTAKAMLILDDLFSQRLEPIIILGIISSAFVDFHRARLSIEERINLNESSKTFGYYGGRSYGFGKAFSAVKNVSGKYLGKCVDILYHTNLTLNSTKADKRLIIERAVTEISALDRGGYYD